MKRVVSIDPGANGGIAVFDEDGLELVDLYTIPKVKDKIDYSALANLLREVIDSRTTVVLEEVHSIFGSSAKSNFSFGHINGVLLGIILSTGRPYVLVQPKEWQKVVWTNQDKVYKPGKAKQTTDTKATSLLAAKRLFPKTDFTKSAKSKIPHDGLIDAALIGKWYIHGNR
jgi:hypothetical protein